MKIRWCYLGLTPYGKAMELMEGLREDVLNGAATEYLLFLEHPPTITRGYSEKGEESGLISTREQIEKEGFEIINTDRGGKTTLHNPGQLVGYVIFDLKRNKFRPKSFVDLIEKTIVLTLDTYELFATTVKGDPGIYVNAEKIAFLGLNIEKSVTTHGFSINVRNDLRPFRHIVSCGQMDRRITSLLEILGDGASVYDVYWRFITCFEFLTGADVEEFQLDELM
jgi:lipoate-protein ligase B